MGIQFWKWIPHFRSIKWSIPELKLGIEKNVLLKVSNILVLRPKQLSKQTRVKKHSHYFKDRPCTLCIRDMRIFLHFSQCVRQAEWFKNWWNSISEIAWSEQGLIHKYWTESFCEQWGRQKRIYPTCSSIYTIIVWQKVF